MPEIRSLVNTSSRYFNILFYNIKYISITPLWFFKILLVLKMQLLTSGFMRLYRGCWDFKHHVFSRIYSLTVYNCTFANYSKLFSSFFCWLFLGFKIHKSCVHLRRLSWWIKRAGIISFSWPCELIFCNNPKLKNPIGFLLRKPGCNTL